MENKQVDKKLQEFKKVVKHFRKKSLQSAEDIHTLRIKCRELFSLLSKDDTLAKSVKKVISLSNEIRDIDVFFSDYLASA
jgi:CHAD domain-containing protein